MNNVSMNQALSIWSELWQAYYGDNSYGYDTAEIYAYRLMPYSPTYQMSNRCDESFKEQNEQVERDAAFSMRNIAYHFAKEMDCIVIIDGDDVDTWRFKNPLFSHRCHVKVIRNDKTM